MSDFVPNQSSNVVIGVCGDTGSGKTVFLTCIFQSIANACPDDLIVEFDRHEIGNADYFAAVEDRIIKQGSPEGTQMHSLFPARIYVKSYQPVGGEPPPVLSVDIQDFAGGQFQSLANLTGLGAPRDSEPERVKALRKVNDIVQKADAFVVLINATQIDPLNETPTRNPFSPSVNFLLAHCRGERKPVALLFSQVDQARLLTDEVFRSMPRVQAFERQFTADQTEAATGGRPFGIVQRISCFETVPGDLAPIRQSFDGNIWRPEPAQVVLELLRAAMPRINARLAEAAAAEQRQQEEAQREREEAQRRESEARKRRTVIAASAAALVLLIALASFIALRLRAESRKVQLLAEVAAAMSGGHLASIPPASEATLGSILSSYRTDRDGTSAELRAAIRELHHAFGQAAQRLAEQPAFDVTYAAELVCFRRLAPVLDPENAAEWRPTLLPLLEARTSFLAEWFERSSQKRERNVILDEAIRQFSAADAVFARLLATESTRARQPRLSTFCTPLPHTRTAVRTAVAA